MAGYSLDLRKRIVDAVERGVGTIGEIAGYSVSTNPLSISCCARSASVVISLLCHTAAARKPN